MNLDVSYAEMSLIRELVTKQIQKTSFGTLTLCEEPLDNDEPCASEGQLLDRLLRKCEEYENECRKYLNLEPFTTRREKRLARTVLERMKA
jgi:hypothetical protein